MRLARSRFALLSLVVATAILVTSVPEMTIAAPGNGATDDEGGTASLRTALDSASRGYSQAKARLATSRQRQAALVQKQRATEAEIAALSKDVQVVAGAAYRSGRINALTAALDSGSISTFMEKARFLDYLSQKNQQRISALHRAQTTLAAQKRQLAGEIRLQQAQEMAMAKRKADAERALNAAGGPSSGFSGGSDRAARSVPRNADGSLSIESCSMDDPTSGGCLTPRMSNALQQARAAGYSRYTACFRQASFGEHGMGRACDFAASSDGFGGVAPGSAKTYGSNLAAYFVNNADRLGVLYVIWFRQVWMPGTGWRAYSGGGSPSAEHTNHVHLSVQ